MTGVKALAGIGLGVAMTLGAFAPAVAQETIKVGILHSLSGTMAISETTLKDTMLFLIDEQNKKGGLLGKKAFEPQQSEAYQLGRTIMQLDSYAAQHRVVDFHQPILSLLDLTLEMCLLLVEPCMLLIPCARGTVVRCRHLSVANNDGH